MPHAPQFIASVAAFTSQPLTALRSQSRNPSAQLLVHEPPEHVVPGHTVVQSPQWLRSLVVLTHVSAQHSRPAGHTPHGTSTGASTTSGPALSGGGVSTATSGSCTSGTSIDMSIDASVGTSRDSASPPMSAPASGRRRSSRLNDVVHATSVAALQPSASANRRCAVRRNFAFHRAARCTLSSTSVTMEINQPLELRDSLDIRRSWNPVDGCCTCMTGPPG